MDSVSQADKGIYKVTARNQYGQAVSECALHVEGMLTTHFTLCLVALNIECLPLVVAIVTFVYSYKSESEFSTTEGNNPNEFITAAIMKQALLFSALRCTLPV